MSVRGTPAPLDRGAWTHEDPSAVNVHSALTWRTDAPAPEVQSKGTIQPQSRLFFFSFPDLSWFAHSLLFPSIAKTFLGTFSVNRLPHDPVIFKSHTVHEIQREIVQLVRSGPHHRTVSRPALRPFGVLTRSFCLHLSSTLRYQSFEVTAAPFWGRSKSVPQLKVLFSVLLCHFPTWVSFVVQHNLNLSYWASGDHSCIMWPGHQSLRRCVLIVWVDMNGNGSTEASKSVAVNLV